MNDAEVTGSGLRGTKFQILKMLLCELDEEFWQQCRTVSPEDHSKYFDTKYESFKQLCPTLFKKSYFNQFHGDEKNKIMELAEKMEKGLLTKTEADSQFAWWMTNRLQKSGRLPTKTSLPNIRSNSKSSATVPQASISAQTKKSNSWLFA